MKNCVRIFVLLFLLLWSLAWIAAKPKAGQAAQSNQNKTETGGERTQIDAQISLNILHDGEIEQMDMKTYLCGVLRAEMPASFEMEALKAQAIAARTYTLYRMENGPIAAHPNADACDDITCCKAYTSAEKTSEQWGDMAREYEDKIECAVAETDGQVVLYDGEPILSVFCSSVGGDTQNAGAVWMSDLPYLQSVDSPETEALVPNYYSVAEFEAEQFKTLILSSYPAADLSGDCRSWVTDIVRNDAGYVAEVCVGGARMRGNELRTVLSLRSPYFAVSADKDSLTFHVTGYGHGVGMSQYGANILAQEGKTCTEILTHYYSGTTVEKWDR